MTALKMAAQVSRRVGVPLDHMDSYQDAYNTAFDRRFHVSTNQEVPANQLGIHGEASQHAVEYAPSSPIDLAILLETLNLNFATSTFVDFGAGKGLVMMTAAEFPFRKILGVEIAVDIHRMAEDNLANYQSRTRKTQDVRCLQIDARDFEFPETPLVIFLFNPFGEPIMESVFANLRISLETQPRECVVIYNNPIHANVVRRAGFSERSLSAALREQFRVFDWPLTGEEYQKSV